MRMRTRVLGAAFAGAMLGWSATAGAEPPASAPKAAHDGAFAPKRQAAAPFVDPEVFFGPSKLLGDAWHRAVTAALEAMKRVAQLARLDARKTIVARTQPLPWHRVIALTRGPAGVERAVVLQAAPIPIEPGSQVVTDGRGQRGLLLGAQATLPWMVP